MTKMIARHSIVVGREGKRVKVPAGTAFDFTAAEIKEIEASEPGVLRNPKNETSEPDASEADAEAEAARLKAEAEAQAAGGKPAAPKVKGAKDDAGGL